MVSGTSEFERCPIIHLFLPHPICSFGCCRPIPVSIDTDTRTHTLVDRLTSQYPLVRSLISCKTLGVRKSVSVFPDSHNECGLATERNRGSKPTNCGFWAIVPLQACPMSIGCHPPVLPCGLKSSSSQKLGNEDDNFHVRPSHWLTEELPNATEIGRRPCWIVCLLRNFKMIETGQSEISS